MPDTQTVLPIDEILHGDSRVELKKLPNACVDSIVTDPPAGISFMSKDWDNPDAWKEDLPSPSPEAEVLPTSGRLADRDAFIVFLRDVMGEAFRVLKPGGFALVWSIPRTSHWTATALEEAGFEIRDEIFHIFGSGFPKSLNIFKTGIKPLVEDELRKQGVSGDIKWR